MKTFYSPIIALAVIFICPPLQAQTYMLDWGSSFSPAWATGNTSGTANNVGGSGIKCTVNLANTGGIFTTTLGSYGGPMTPTVSASTFIVAGSTKNLQISLDYTTNTQYTDITFTFTAPVFNLSFNLADIDRLTNTTYSYLDEITITGYHGAFSGSPTITKYDPTTDPNFIIISGGTAYVNPANNMSGNSMSDASDQKGTIKVQFAGIFINSFTIRYANYVGTQADPGVQNIAIGNISFQKTIPLPVALSSFDGKVNEKDNVDLNWITAQEENLEYFSIERSENGDQFEEIGRVTGTNVNSKATYQYTDSKVYAPKYYYRLKMMDLDGAYTYSKIIVLITNTYSGFKAFPTVFHDELTVALYTPKAEKLKLMVTDAAGRIVWKAAYASLAGSNEFKIKLPAAVPPGQYYVLSENGYTTVKVIRQ